MLPPSKISEDAEAFVIIPALLSTPPFLILMTPTLGGGGGNIRVLVRVPLLLSVPSIVRSLAVGPAAIVRFTPPFIVTMPPAAIVAWSIDTFAVTVMVCPALIIIAVELALVGTVFGVQDNGSFQLPEPPPDD
ncbi:MAG: hypothetical protein M9954_15425 [Cyclobacteriaceae bacterium]|nr:hypothetical protein [Cyclobacteriaceae bacterium]